MSAGLVGLGWRGISFCSTCGVYAQSDSDWRHKTISLQLVYTSMTIGYTHGSINIPSLSNKTRALDGNSLCCPI